MYRRLCSGLNDKGVLIPAESDVYEYITDEKDYYLSIFKYTEDHKEVFAKTGTIAGITNVTTDRVLWDFDNEQNPQEAKDKTTILVSRLIEKGIDTKDIVISFSGKKGFGVEVKVDKEIDSGTLKLLTAELAGDLGDSFDQKIYNPSRIIRVPATKHPKSGLYKTPLTYKQLLDLTLEEIKHLAKEPPVFNEEEFRWGIVPLWAIPEKKEEVKPVVVSDFLDIDFTRKIKGWTNCKWALTQGYQISSGDRHEKLLCIVSTSKALNYSKEQAYYNAKNADEQGVIRNGGTKSHKEDIWQMVESVYDVKWLGGTFSCRDGKTPWLTSLCKSLGTCKCKKDEETIFMKSPDLFDSFYKFVLNIDKNTIKTGIAELDENVMLTTSSLNGFLGQPGAGKTSIALNILNKCNADNIPAIFYSMDMGVPLIYLKLAQKHWGIPHKEIFELIKNNKNKAKELKALIDKEYSKTEMCFKTGLNVDEIKETILLYNETRPEKAKVVIIDYLECIAGPYSDATANTAIIANKLKDIAIETETCILLLLQTQKHAGAPDEPLLSMRNIKGSSVIEQACSVVVTLWREGYNPKYPNKDKFMSMATVKDRFNSLWKYDFKWNGLLGQISNLEDHEQDELEKLRDMKAQDKSGQLSKTDLNF